MKLAVIKKLAETQTIDNLRLAEEAILNEEKPQIEIDGEDEGEQLTHAIAAIQILSDMEKEGVDLRTALRAYTERVRNSIS
jgi:hypothetical protein